MNRIMITGGAGYIGCVLTSMLLKKGHQVFSLDNLKHSKLKYLRKFNKYKKFKFFKCDINNLSQTEKFIKNNKINTIVHLAGIVGDPASKLQKKLTKKTNLESSKKIFFLCEKYNVKKFIFASTCSNYGIVNSKKLADEKTRLKPLSLYAKTKVDFEKYLMKDSSIIQKIILRISTLYGFSHRMRFDLTVNEFIKKMYHKEKLEIYHKDTWRPYLSLEDLKLIVSKLINYPFKKNKIILNTGFNNENFSKKNIVDKIEKQLKFKPKYTYVEKAHFDKRNYRVDFTKLKKMKIKQRFSFEKNMKLIISYLNKINKRKSNYKVFYNHK